MKDIKFTVNILFMVFYLCSIPQNICSQDNQNTITFDNKSGEPTLVKVIGPSGQTVEVPNGQSRTVNAAAGEYYILVRYGSNPEKYSFAKGDTFTVTQTTNQYSATTITLHKILDGNYPTRPISYEEFDKPLVVTTVNSKHIRQPPTREKLASPGTAHGKEDTRVQQKGDSISGVSESSAMLTSISFKNDSTTLKVILSEAQLRGDRLYSIGKGEVALAITHLLDPNRETKKRKLKLGPTTTVIMDAEAYKATGQLRTEDDEEMIGIQGRCFLEVYLLENERGTVTAIPNIESEGLTFRNSFKNSKVKMLMTNYSNILEGKVVKDTDGQFKFKQDVSQNKQKKGK